MRFAEADNSNGHLIEGYGPDGIQVSGRTFRASLVLTPERILESWGPSAAEALTQAHLDAILDLEPQVILLGTGSRQVFLPPELQFAVLERGVGLEVMDTGAACRTYNILMAEGRRVAAAFILG